MNSIFKYTKYRKEFFENFLLRLSRFGEFNDPFEMVPGSFGFSLSEDEAAEFFAHSSRLSDPDYHLDNYVNVMAGVRASLGVICFTSREDNLLMWAHYGENHEGICIEFDAGVDFFTGKYLDALEGAFIQRTVKDHYKNTGELKEVKYSKVRPLFIDPSEIEYDTDSWLTKSEAWAYEQEYRILLPIDFAVRQQDMLFYEVDKKSIKSVILGCQIGCEKKKEINSICSKLGIRVRESFVNSSEYKLDIVDYHPDNHNSYANYYSLERVTRY